MSNLAITAESLGKRYRIGSMARRARTLKEALANTVKAPLRNLQRLRRLTVFGQADDPDVIWALRDLSFELKHGEVFGIIGRNGAGKSTLLKILSRITRPTTGRARISGRVGALLEVGTGFHPELTGRENVYLNGSILGMDRRSIARKFDAIVEFAGVAQFIDTPVKRYSSGMHLRLAFAVAAHLEPEILIVDEVLAVGDIEFQQKCLLQMDEVATQGRTVLFVSHNLGAIQRLCTRSLLLDQGRAIVEGQTPDVVRRYLAIAGAEAPPVHWLDLTAARRQGSGLARYVAVSYSSPDPLVDFRPYPGAPLDITVRIRAEEPVLRAGIGFRLRDQAGGALISGSTTAIGSPPLLPAGISTWSFRIARLSLRPGTYQLDLWLGDSSGIHDRLQSALRLDVFDRQARSWGPAANPRHDGPVFCEYEVVAVETGSDEIGTALDRRDERPLSTVAGGCDGGAT